MFRCLFALAALLLLFAPARAELPDEVKYGPYDPKPYFDLTYGTGELAGGGSTNLKLDLYVPTTNFLDGTPPPSWPTPGIVLVHGGGVNKNTDPYISPLAGYLASYGYNVASINYRSPEQLSDLGLIWYQGAAQDVEKALTWMQDNSAKYNIDPDQLGLGGSSAGAIISIYEAYANPSRTITPKVLLDFMGAAFDPFLHLDGPPAFITHGTADGNLPFSYAQDLVQRLNAAGIYNEFYPQPGVGHAIYFDLVIDGKYLFQHNLDFLDKFLPVPEPSTLCQSTIASAIALAAAIQRARRKRANRTLAPAH